MQTYASKMKFVAATSLLILIGFIVANARVLLSIEPTSFGTMVSGQMPTNQSPYVSASSYTTSPSGTSNTGYSTPTSDTTTNWAGYVSTGGTYTSVSGTWTVPNVSATNDSIAADATWIGIGGDTSDDLVQIGTQNEVQDGQVTTGTFYERLPDTSESVPGVNVNAGDTVTASIKEVSIGDWAISINDLTNGESYNNTVAYTSSESSAEWIEEAPSTGTSIIPLDQFGSVTFSNGTTTKNGATVSIANSGAQILTMDNESGEALTSTSAIDSAGSGFTVTRTDASSSDEQSGYGAYGVIPNSGWTRHEPGRGMWRQSQGWGWGSGASQSYDFTNYY